MTFDKDVILSPANEYEVLQLLLGECKTRLGGYAGGRLSSYGGLSDRDLTESDLSKAAERQMETAEDMYMSSMCWCLQSFRMHSWDWTAFCDPIPSITDHYSEAMVFSSGLVCEGADDVGL